MNNQVKTILETVRYATLSTVDESGRAWAAPVWYVFDEREGSEGGLYWWSPIDSRHSQNIERNGDVYITIFDSTTPEGKGVGLYIRAHAEQVPDDQLDGAIAHYNTITQKFKLSRTNTTGSAPTRLYRATPIRIYINDGVETDGFYRDIRRETA